MTETDSGITRSYRGYNKVIRDITRGYNAGTRGYNAGTRDYDSITRSYRREREGVEAIGLD